MIEKFRIAFSIPEDHDLIEIKTRAKGPGEAFDSWWHEEKDSAGHVIARYESWHNTTPSLNAKSGFKKYSTAGVLVSEKNQINI